MKTVITYNRSETEWSQVDRFLEQAYRHRGILPEELPRAEVTIATLNDNAITGTASLTNVPPLWYYAEECPAPQVIRFAAIGSNAWLDIFRAIYGYAIDNGIRELSAAYHPHHRRIYKMMGFVEIGVIDQYHLANGNPAVAGSLNISTIENDKPRLYELILGDGPHGKLHEGAI